MDATEKRRALAEIARAVSVCNDCGLARGRTHAVPGEGDPAAQIVFIGEGPGFYEDQQGRPFVGASGKFLDELLRSIGLDRKTVFIGNVVKCRPPQNRDPQPDEITACAKHLEGQLAAIAPKVVVTLGRHSMQRYFPGESISRVHGQPRRKGDVIVVPMYHPAAALHQGSLRATIEADFRRLPEFLSRALGDGLDAAAERVPAHLRTAAQAAAAPKPAPAAAPVPANEPEPQQMRLL
ncbi:MAG: uracil-DNA glycosylase [Dehalococcoidia bacterium]|nr:MAG: uracil-DNA glycosylase [Dehalococcoidia bacterium]